MSVQLSRGGFLFGALAASVFPTGLVRRLSVPLATVAPSKFPPVGLVAPIVSGRIVVGQIMTTYSGEWVA